ncbi:MAG: restriction endonuclease [Spirochaetaceae bacterium]|nr:restriction endonuclease [Spirochaetaceae bacterium]
MEALFIILPVAIVIIVIAVIMAVKKDGGKPQKNNSKQTQVARHKVLADEAKKRLTANPHDLEAAQKVADIFYAEKNYTEAFKYYSIIIDTIEKQPSLASNINLHPIRVTAGLTALKLKKYDEAHKLLSLAFASKKDFNVDLLLGLGELEYYRKAYDKAVYYFQFVLKYFKENTTARQFLGYIYYKQHKYNDTVAMLREVLPHEADNKELIFTLANAYNELNKADNALKLFTHLLNDNTYGAASALYAGSILFKAQKYDFAANIFINGLKHTNIRTEVMLELRYRLAQTYFKQNHIDKALALFYIIRTINPSYKNVSAEIERYSELAANKNFNIYLSANATDFSVLCRKIIPVIFKKAKIKISNVNAERSDYIDIMADVKTDKLDDNILFRFYRVDNLVIEEQKLRDLDNIMRKNRQINRSFALCAGTFSSSASTYVEARLIELINRQELMQLLSKVTG